MVTKDIAREIMELAAKTGKSISSISAELGHNPGNVHNAISRLRRADAEVEEAKTSESDSGTPVQVAKSKTNARKPIAVAKKSNGTRRAELHADERTEADNIALAMSSLANNIKSGLFKASIDNPAMSFALGYALKTIDACYDSTAHKHIIASMQRTGIVQDISSFPRE